MKSKYPEGRDVSVENFPEFESCPEMIDIIVTEENVEKVAKSFPVLLVHRESTLCRFVAIRGMFSF